mmetsp:Transcript_11106/g.34056  ORF Transcript_11106/g.34056 Transcript_11106/m.34056 type:complete len:183 (+) Transcript_11106:140-688(+)|eukprot:CAMPEP_0198731192 /NCGR_PEP_ID=MMETSP1475-20131203/28587_1 /TAXON_ID= ORGANISM="Unidentified sp., Strain CCMP1999" /NCGR_SAMPLE_ID=MMETSP1475 /ASSEMBLY_ACC=CAM_ASM_001111 /LENGTH=182 /DNA_ID=CAMNT_0044494121 /DNA_START=115 /DNA_END=663 /DNA_ORIENTATION=-
MADCFGGLCSCIQSLLRKIGLFGGERSESTRLIADDAGEPARYGGVDAPSYQRDSVDYDDLQGESENLGPYREILERTAEKLIDIIPAAQTVIDHRDIGNRPEMYRNALKKSHLARQGAEKQSPNPDSLRKSTSILRAALHADDFSPDDVNLIRQASSAMATAAAKMMAVNISGIVIPLIAE